MPQNRAAWLVGLKQYPLQVGDAPYVQPNADQVLIRVAYAAMNPGPLYLPLRRDTSNT